MNRLLDRLIQTIADEAVLFENFLKLLERQQGALIKGDADVIQETTAELQIVIQQSRQLEHSREEIVEQLRQEAGRDDSLTVSKISEMADAARGSQLAQLRETILGLYTRIEETRMRNGLLVEQSVEQIHHTLNMISRIPERKETYRQQGTLRTEYAPVGVDRRV